MPAKQRLSTTMRGYGHTHQAKRRELEPFVLAGGVDCVRCGLPIAPGEQWHLGHTDDRSAYTGPEHARCNIQAAGEKATRMRWSPPPPPEPEPERVGIPQDDARWRVPWLEGLLEPPADAVWPRFMTAPHPAATGSLGAEFVESAEAREGQPLRWWQRLVATRLLETDRDGRLVWETMLLTMARQLGKSWLLRELLLWRIHQGERFGEKQDVIHTGKDLQVCEDVIQSAMYWADGRPGYKVTRANGRMGIQRESDRSRWMLRAKGAVYGASVSVAAADEAWKIAADAIDEGLMPTMVAREQPQLWLISTAHRQATALMLYRRKAALEQLESAGGDLLIEWSAAKTVELGDVAGWREASPHWTGQRERLIRRQFETAEAGEGERYEDEVDPLEAFRAQWLNQWPDRSVPMGVADPLLPAGLWAWLADPAPAGGGPVYVAAEDHFGRGAAVAACRMLDDGRLELDGWLCPDWDSAMADVERLVFSHEVRTVLVGASLLASVPEGFVPAPEPAGGRETRLGLPLLRELAAAGRVVHDRPGERTADLDQAIGSAQVKELQTGLAVASSSAPHLVRAAVWALNAAYAPAPETAVY